MTPAAKPSVRAIGDNGTAIWSMRPVERLRRIANKFHLAFEPDKGRGPQLLVNLAYAFDPELLRYMANSPAQVLVDANRRPVIAHIDGSHGELASRVETAMKGGNPLPDGLGVAEIVGDQHLTIYNQQLRKRSRPFVMLLTDETRPAVERASYYAAYKGVTDILTKYLWPEAALVLTRAAARLGISPNMVTAIGAALCVLAAYLFWHGAYWWGMAAGLGFMVLDTVDGKLARCTITSSRWGNIFDHGIDQIHPPIWWWAWAMGLDEWGQAFGRHEFTIVMTIVISGYLFQRLIETMFMRLFGMHIHVWQCVDSRFRLVTARRNPNMVLLLAGLVVGRPDIGLELVAAWTIVSCLFHAARLAQALVRRGRGYEVRSWLG